MAHGAHAARDKQSVVHTATLLRIGMRVCEVVVPGSVPKEQQLCQAVYLKKTRLPKWDLRAERGAATTNCFDGAQHWEVLGMFKRHFTAVSGGGTRLSIIML